MKTIVSLILSVFLFISVGAQTPFPTASVKIGQIKAFDPNFGQTLSYSIIGGESVKHFILNSKTGLLSVDKKFYGSFKEERKFVITVMVTDNGKPSMSSKASVTIFIHRKGAPKPTMEVNANGKK